MVERQTKPPELDLTALPGPETVHRAVLENDIVVLARANFASPSTVLGGYLHAGSLYESPGEAGLANLTASALMRGTEDRSFNSIYETVESIGASLRIGGGTHFASFRGKSLAEDLEQLLELLADVLRRPAFPEKEVSQLRGEKLTGLAMRDQDTRAVASMTFDELVYADHPYRWPSDGLRETVAALEPSHLRDFHRRRYVPAGMVLSIVGGIAPERAVELAGRAFSDWRVSDGEGRAEVPEQGAPPDLVRRDVSLAGKTQSDLVVGTPGPRRSDPGYLAAALGNNILGRFGLMGRIGDRVREEAGLAYYAYSSVNGGIGPGPWQVMAGVNPVNVDQALDLIMEELARFSTEMVTEEELSDVQANFIGRLPLQLESNEGVASALINVERHDLGLDYYQRFPAKVRAVTREEILEVAQKFVDTDRLAIAVAGPGEDKA